MRTNNLRNVGAIAIPFKYMFLCNSSSVLTFFTKYRILNYSYFISKIRDKMKLRKKVLGNPCIFVTIIDMQPCCHQTTTRAEEFHLEQLACVLEILSKVIVLMLFKNCLRSYRKICSQSKSIKMGKEVASTNIVWMDLEMTGLDIRKDKILEVSCLITDRNLNIIFEGPCFAIKHPKEILDNMDEWCIKNHNESGLVEKCLQSQVTLESGEKTILEFLKKNVPKGHCPLAGNSVYMDRLFLRDQMPSVEGYMHYRIIDVSTIKELARRWNLSVYDKAPKKKLTHRSLDDIKESIEELRYYRHNFLNVSE